MHVISLNPLGCSRDTGMITLSLQMRKLSLREITQLGFLPELLTLVGLRHTAQTSRLPESEATGWEGPLDSIYLLYL